MTSLLDKWRLLVRIAEDPRLSKGSEVRVAAVLLDHFNLGTGRCDPSVDTLAERMATTDRAVSRALANLVACGYVTATRRGWHRSSTYAPIFKQSEVTPTSSQDAADEVTPTSSLAGSEVTPTSPREVTPTSPKSEKEKPVRKDEHGKDDPAAVVTVLFPVAGNKPPAPTAEPLPVPPKRKPRTNNLAAFDAFRPTDDQLAKLRADNPRVAGNVDLLVKQFRLDEWLRDAFTTGKRSDPWLSLQSFISKREEWARNAGGVVGSGSQLETDEFGAPRINLQDALARKAAQLKQWNVE